MAEMARIEYHATRSVLVCPCSGRFLFRCDKHGADALDGACLRCWTCGRVITADGAVIGRTEVIA